MRTQMAGVSEMLAGGRLARHRRYASAFTGSGLGYGWPATLELLYPPDGKPIDSRHRRTISPAIFLSRPVQDQFDPFTRESVLPLLLEASADNHDT